MFGILAGGRACGSFDQIDETRFGYTIEDASKIHYMAVFLIPGAQIPPDAAGSVYVQLPGQEFKMLGYLSSEKQSAIFKFNANQISTAITNDVDEMMDDEDGSTAASKQDFIVNVGISLESLEQAQQQLDLVKQAQAAAPKAIGTSQPILPPAPKTPSDIAVLGNKIVKHAYNYMSSFTDGQGNVPIKAFNAWWDKFTNRLKSDPNFLDEEL